MSKENMIDTTMVDTYSIPRKPNVNLQGASRTRSLTTGEPLYPAHITDNTGRTVGNVNHAQHVGITPDQKPYDRRV